MSEVKDPAIKLFGKTIQLPSNDDVSDHNISCSSEKNDAASDSKQEDDSSSTVLVDANVKEPTKSDKEEESESGSSSQQQQQDKPLKKPDKILPCPRCNSMDTKFCYFNNYNVNQPRHFCKNCQRYWTAGGTMRNVPVGAGRRKSKNTSSQSHSHPPRHVVIPESLQTRPNGIIYPALPLCESMASTLNIADNGCSNQVPCFLAPPWPHPWNPAPPFLPYWGYGVPGSWMTQMPSVSAEHSSLTSLSPNSPLGKHSRDGNGTERRVLTPKTLRIDDPNEAAKSSIWATLGIKNEKGDSINSGGLFRGFKSKGDGDDEMNLAAAADTSLVLQANPAALSRSLTFHESAQ